MIIEKFGRIKTLKNMVSVLLLIDATLSFVYFVYLYMTTLVLDDITCVKLILNNQLFIYKLIFIYRKNVIVGDASRQ